LKQIYHPYWLWEDYKNGFYNIEITYSETEEYALAIQARDLLADSERFNEVALKVISEWKYAAEVNLSNTARNRQAWLGQASCCYELKIPDYITKYGWRMLTPEQQTKANQIADSVIEKWEGMICQKDTSLLMFM
jgi:hypothetical protein